MQAVGMHLFNRKLRKICEGKLNGEFGSKDHGLKKYKNKNIHKSLTQLFLFYRSPHQLNLQIQHLMNKPPRNHQQSQKMKLPHQQILNQI